MVDVMIEMWRTRLEIESLDDDYLLEEVLDLNYFECPDAERIVANYIKTGSITSEERKRLEGYYLLVWVGEDYEE